MYLVIGQIIIILGKNEGMIYETNRTEYIRNNIEQYSAFG